jgi:hypothetical protein
VKTILFPFFQTEAVDTRTFDCGVEKEGKNIEEGYPRMID